MIKDILPMKQTSHRCQSELALLIADHLKILLAYWDKNLVCRYANSAYVHSFGKTKKQLVNNIHIHELLGPMYEKNLPFIKAVLLGQTQKFQREIVITGSKKIGHALATYTPDLYQGDVVGFFVHVAETDSIKLQPIP